MLRFLLRHVLVGSAIGWSFLAILFAFDTGGLFTLISHAANPALPLMLLLVAFSVTFGSAAVASAVLMGVDFDERGTLPRRRLPVLSFLDHRQPELRPVPVRVKVTPRHEARRF
ncbi:hypothetical protein CLD20_00145 [Afifella sp. IM 167]|nr:hypothetical protein [Afifella sp. IM 167]